MGCRISPFLKVEAQILLDQENRRIIGGGEFTMGEEQANTRTTQHSATLSFFFGIKFWWEKRTWHLATTSIVIILPSFFRRHKVERSTLKIALCRIYHEITVRSCPSRYGGVSAVESRQACIYCKRCRRHGYRQYVSVAKDSSSPAPLARWPDQVTVLVKLHPRMVTSWW